MGFFEKLKQGLSKTASSISSVFTASELDDEFYDDLEESLIVSDLGMDTTEAVMDRLRQTAKEQHIKTVDEAKLALRGILADMLNVGDPALKLDTKPSVILVIGVNGVGKTTTIGKLAHQLHDQGKKVLLCAGDTFRAAAAEQLTVWADRAGCDIVRRARELAAAGKVTALVDAAALGFADSDSERILAGSRGEIPAEARLARLWVDGPAPGDVMCPLGMSGRSKKVSDLLGEARIPVSERAGVPVVRTAPGGAVVWVAGVRADERFKCTAATRVAYLLRVVDAE